MCRDRTDRHAFTLVELLVVIAIIGILAALIIPAVSSGIAKSRQVKCAANLKAVGAAMQMYLDDHDMRMPYLDPQTQFLQFSILGPYIDNDWNLLHCPAAKASNRGPTWSDYTTNVSGTVRYTDYRMNDNTEVVEKRVSTFRSDSWLVVMMDMVWTPEAKERHHGGDNMLFLDGSVQWKNREEQQGEDPWGNFPWDQWATHQP